MFPYKKLAVAAIVVFLGVPSVSMAGSVALSLIQGKTPAEAISVLAEQVDTLFGRVQELESQQVQTADEIQALKEENERLQGALEGKADVVVPKGQTPECLALKAEMEAAKAKNEPALDALAKKMQVLRKERAELRRGEYSTLGDRGDQNDDPTAWQAKIDEIRERDQKLEQQLDDLEKQQDALIEQTQTSLAPLQRQAEEKDCLLG